MQTNYQLKIDTTIKTSQITTLIAVNSVGLHRLEYHRQGIIFRVQKEKIKYNGDECGDA
jgi:hypothetical protein